MKCQSNWQIFACVSPSTLKTAKVVPVSMKDSKLDYSNYRPISLLPNIEEILEKYLYKRLCRLLGLENFTYLLNNMGVLL